MYGAELGEFVIENMMCTTAATVSCSAPPV